MRKSSTTISQLDQKTVVVRRNGADGHAEADLASAPRTSAEAAVEVARSVAVDFYHAMGESVPALVWACLADGTACYVNSHWCEYTGLTLETASDIPNSVMHHREDYARLTEIALEASRRGVPFEAEFRFRRHDGEYRWFETHVIPIKDNSGKVRVWVGTSTDIHEQKKIVESLRTEVAERTRAEYEIRQLNERLQLGIRETHHRVKNNLQIVTAMIDMLALEHSQDDTVPMAQMQRLGVHIRTLAVVHDLLTQSVREAEDEQRIGVGVILDRLLPLLQQGAGQRKIHASLANIEITSKRAVSLALVLNELVSNALKHGKGRIDVVFSAGGNEGTLEVRDSGPGFPTNFDPEAAANTGLELVLGLSVTDLEARLEFLNRPEGGALVRVRFPLVSSPPADAVG